MAEADFNHFKAGFKIGSQITGRVANVLSNNHYVVSLRGLQLVAQSDLPLKKGQLFRAKVRATEPKLELKIIRDGVSESLLKDWAVGENDRHILEEMSAAKLSMEKEIFNRVRDVVRRFRRHPGFRASSEEIARAAVRLEQLGLPATEDNMAVQLAIVKGDTKITQLLQHLMSMFSRFENELPVEIRQFLQNLPEAFTPQNIARNLPAIVNLLGMMHESALKKLLGKMKLTKSVNLKWAMLFLKEAGIEAESINKLARNLEALQIQNLPDSRPSAGDNFQLQIPVFFQGRWEEANINFNFGGNKKHLDRDNASIRITLDSHNLGNMAATIDINGGAMIINLAFQSDEIADFVREHISELAQSLEALDYKIRSLTVTGAGEEEILSPGRTISHPIDDGIDFFA